MNQLLLALTLLMATASALKVEADGQLDAARPLPSPADLQTDEHKWKKYYRRAHYAPKYKFKHG